jgi:hypothetical protein
MNTLDIQCPFEYLSSVQMCNTCRKTLNALRAYDPFDMQSLSRPVLKLTSKSMQIAKFIPFPDNNNLATYYKIINMWTKGRARKAEKKRVKWKCAEAGSPERT